MGTQAGNSMCTWDELYDAIGSTNPTRLGSLGFLSPLISRSEFRMHLFEDNFLDFEGVPGTQQYMQAGVTLIAM